jgi:integrase
MNRGGSKLWQGDQNPCFLIEKFPEKKDKKFLELATVIEIINYIKNNLWRDPHFMTFYLLLLDIGERLEDVFGLAWREPTSEVVKLKCSGWLLNNNTQVYIKDSKDRNEATVDLTAEATEVINKLMSLRSDDNSNAAFAAGSMYVFPRSTDTTLHINNSSYRKKLEKFNYKFGLAKKELVSSYGSRKRFKYKMLFSFKHLRKTFGTHYGRKYGLQEQSERMRHSSTKVTKEHYYNQSKDKFKGRSAYDIGTNVVQLKDGTNND